VRDEIEQYRTKGVQPLGMNPASVESHEKYSAKFTFNFPLVSDADRAAARGYRALKSDGRGILRTVYLIGADGRIRFAQRGMPAVEAILKPLG
jgi:peroxiredoxin Q/BCP